MISVEQAHILLVDDDDVDREGVERLFRKNNIGDPLSIAKDGYEAMCMLKGTDGYQKLESLPHIILLDINMPKINGFEFLKEIRKDKSFDSVLVFMFSTSDSRQDIDLANQLNVNGYIVKPIDEADVSNMMGILRDVFESE